MIYVIWTVIMVAVLAVVFLWGRSYERKQFVHIGKKKPTTQDVILGGKK